MSLAVGVSVLVGWFFQITVLKSVLPGLTTMKANTAIGLAAAAIGLLLLSVRGWRGAQLTAGGVVALLGLLTLAEYLSGMSLGLDELLFRDPDTTSMPFPGRMSPATAIAFVGLGGAVMLLGSARSRFLVSLGHALTALPAAVGYLSLAGYTYGVEGLYSFGPFVSVALHTAWGLLTLSWVALMTRADRGWLAAYRDRPVSRTVLLRLLVFSVIVPFVVGLVVVKGVRSRYYEAIFGPALFAVAGAAGFIWLTLRAAGTVRDAEEAMLRARDEADRRGAALQESEARFAGIVASVDQMIWSTRPDGFHDFYNQRWYEFTGTPPGSTDGEGWNSVFHPDEQGMAWERWRHSLATGEPYHIEYRLRHRSGAYRWVLGRAQPVFDGAGRITRWYGTCTDIEEIVVARDVLARTQDDLERRVEARTRELEAAQAALRQSQKMEAVGQLTGGIAHDFNNLMTIIRSAADFLRRRDLAEDRRRRYVDAISDTVDRAAKLTGQLLAFARRQPRPPVTFDLSQQTKSIETLIRPLLGPRIQIDLIGFEHPCFALADIGQFETALVNLAVNARDAMLEEGTLTLELAEVDVMPALQGQPVRPGAFVSVAVTDTGVGIPSDRLEVIFEPFFTTKALGKGTGLGLSQVFGFARQSGGDISVASEEGRGTTFTLFLPRGEPYVTQSRETGSKPKRSLDGRGARVLVVEDNEEVGRFSTEMLQDLGYQTVWASEATAALLALEAPDGHFDLVFSDVIMPGMNGVDLACLIRERYPDLPVVLTSGYSSVLAEKGQKGFELIKKPYSVEALSFVLRRAVQRGVGPVADSIDV